MEKREKTVVLLRRAALAACLLAGVCSCKKDGGDGQSPAGGGVFTAVTESHAGDGKTTIDGGQVKWKVDDEIKVYSSGTSWTSLSFFALDEGITSDFDYTGDLPDNFIAENNSYAAVYPSSNTFAMGEDGKKTFTVDFPPERNYADEGFADGENPMVAFAENSNELAFKNVCGLLKLQLCGVTPVKDIKIKTKGTNPICGHLTFKYDADGNPEYLEAASDAGHEIIVHVSEAADYKLEDPTTYLDLNIPKEFLIPLPAGSCEEGFVVTVSDPWGGEWSKTALGEDNKIERSKIKTMKKVRAITYVKIGNMKWATVNIGAHAPWEYGDYYAWGATETWYKTKPDGIESESVVTLTDWKNPAEDGGDKSLGYVWATARFQTDPTVAGNGTGENTKWSKYVPKDNAYSSYWSEGFSGDDKEELDEEDDVARAVYGSPWRMPQASRIDDTWDGYSGDFKDLCTAGGITGISSYGALVEYGNGHSVKGLWLRVGGVNKLFLPAAGYCMGASRSGAGSGGRYLARSLEFTPSYVYRLGFRQDGVFPSDGNYRFEGCSVRPIMQ